MERVEEAEAEEEEEEEEKEKAEEEEVVVEEKVTVHWCSMSKSDVTDPCLDRGTEQLGAVLRQAVVLIQGTERAARQVREGEVHGARLGLHGIGHPHAGHAAGSLRTSTSTRPSSEHDLPSR